MQLKPCLQIALAFLGAIVTNNLPGQAALTVEQCRQMAITNSPLNAQKSNAITIANLQTSALKAGNLPKIAFGAQATLQSHTFGLPIESPLFEVPSVPRDQYKLNIDVSQRIWDGNSDQIKKRQYALDTAVAAAQTNADIFSLREVVTDLFFNALLLQESVTILETSKKDLYTRLQQVEAAISNGILLRTNADQIKIQLLKIDQQITATESDKRALMDLLALWIGREQVDFTLVPTPEPTQTSMLLRPEIKLFQLREQQLDISTAAIGLRSKPRVEAFAQAGVGAPNPYNFFENGVFGMAGIRAVWTPFDWGTSQKEKQALLLQRNNIAAQRSNFESRIAAATRKDSFNAEKNKTLLAQDDAIIALQESIIARADAQVKNGMMTMTDYLAQVNLLTQAQLTKKTHELQIIHAKERTIAINGQ